MNECIEFEERSEAGKERNQKRVREKRNLDGNGGVMGMIIPSGDDSVIAQNDDVVMDFFRNALGAGGWYGQPESPRG